MPKTENSLTTILLAEDEPALRGLLRRIFGEREGYTLLVAEDGQEAIDIANKHQGRIDLLLSDIQMPRMSGPDLAEILRKSRRDLRILLISAFPEGLLMLDRGWHFLQKPFLPKTIVDKVQQVLDQPPAPETHKS